LNIYLKKQGSDEKIATASLLLFFGFLIQLLTKGQFKLVKKIVLYSGGLVHQF